MYIVTMSNEHEEFLIAKAKKHGSDEFIFDRKDVIVECNLNIEKLQSKKYIRFYEEKCIVREENTFYFKNLNEIIVNFFENIFILIII